MINAGTSEKRDNYLFCFAFQPLMLHDTGIQIYDTGFSVFCHKIQGSSKKPLVYQGKVLPSFGSCRENKTAQGRFTRVRQ